MQLMRVSSFRVLCVPLLCCWVLSSGLGHVLSDHVLAEHQMDSRREIHGYSTLFDVHGADEKSAHEHQIASDETPYLVGSGARALLLVSPPSLTPVQWVLDAASSMVMHLPVSRPRAGPASFQLRSILRI